MFGTYPAAITLIDSWLPVVSSFWMVIRIDRKGFSKRFDRCAQVDWGFGNTRMTSHRDGTKMRVCMKRQSVFCLMVPFSI